MLNQEIRTITLERGDMFNIRRALLEMIISCRNESNRKYWMILREKVIAQLAEQDPEEYK